MLRMAQTFGRWQIDRPLGEGGQAHTFLVRDTTGEYPDVAVLKRLKNPSNPQRLARFKQEAEALQRVSHPHVLKLVDFSVDDPKPYIVTEYCAGGNLAEANVQDLPLERRMDLCLEITDGLSATHSAGIVHRDIKPENIFLRAAGGPAVVGDFGLSFFENGERQTLVDEAVGPWLFMAPELEDGAAQDVAPTADVYSLGKVVYWVLTGKTFSREKHRQQPFSLVALKQDERFEHFSQVLDSMIVAAPSERLKDANMAWQRLERACRLFLDGYRAIGVRPSRCDYCGLGPYQMLRTHSSTDLHNTLGIASVGSPRWRIFCCANCGHLLYFRPDLSKNPDWLEGK